MSEQNVNGKHFVLKSEFLNRVTYALKSYMSTIQNFETESTITEDRQFGSHSLCLFAEATLAANRQHWLL